MTPLRSSDPLPDLRTHADLVSDEQRWVRQAADGELAEHGQQLARVLAMADPDGLADWMRQWFALRMDLMREELRWRQRAGRRGAPGLDYGHWEEFVAAIRERIDLVRVFHLCGVDLRERHGTWWARCFAHDDTTPSLEVNAEKKLWHCFGCGAGGDAFTVVELRRGLEFGDAARWLGEIAGVALRKPELEGPVLVCGQDVPEL